jgi:hypothetical protein
MPNARAGRRYARAKQKAKRSTSLTAAMLLADLGRVLFGGCERLLSAR